jgi:hypothetical protein
MGFNATFNDISARVFFLPLFRNHKMKVDYVPGSALADTDTD